MKEKWWKKAVAYQIYPKSFSDSNNDGIGDIRGIIDKLDYLKALGIQVIWICPVCASPMDDNGYDVSDYYKIDPMFGSNADMEELIQEALKRGIRILMDLVVNHCSDEHIWFQKALADSKCEEASYFIFRETKDGLPPNNGRSIFGGSCWSRVGESNRYYLHVFGDKQPDLNWENPKLREEVYKIVQFWMEKGLGGFRIDAITSIKKNLDIPHFTPDGPDGLAQITDYIQNQPGIGVFLSELRDKGFKKFDALTVAEAPCVPYDQLGEFVGENGYFDMIFDFAYADLDVEEGKWYRPVNWTVKEFRELLYKSQEKLQENGCFGAPFLENHDQPRSLTKYIPKDYRDAHSAKMLGVLLLTLRGMPFIYQGEELGMQNFPFEKVEDYRDSATFDQYDETLVFGHTPDEALDYLNKRSRDQSRIVFPWNDSKNGGFTEAEPWIQADPDYRNVNVEKEMADPDSVLNFYKKLIQLRTASDWSDALTEGNFEVYAEGNENVIAYKRFFENTELLVLLNMGTSPAELLLPDEDYEVLVNNEEFLSEQGENTAVLSPFQAVVLGKKTRPVQA